MIFVHWPLMLCALLPVILLEALLMRRWLALSFRDVFVGVGKANVLSTLVGVPLAWLAMFALQLAVMLPFGLAAETSKWQPEGPVWEVLGFLFSVAWLLPAEGYLHWMVPAAVALLLVPCFYLSVLLERSSCLRSWPAAQPARVRRGVLAANLASYALLFVLASGWVAVELITKGPYVETLCAELSGPANGSQPIRSETNQTSSAAGSRR